MVDPNIVGISPSGIADLTSSFQRRVRNAQHFVTAYRARFSTAGPCRFPGPFGGPLHLVAILSSLAVSLIACSDTGKAQSGLEKSRLDVLGRVRHLRSVSSKDVRAGDLISGNYRICKKGSVNYVARTDWIGDSNAKKSPSVIAALVADFSRDGWSIRSESNADHAVLNKEGFTADLTGYPGGAIVKGYVMGVCHKIGDSANDYAKRSADEYDE